MFSKYDMENALWFLVQSWDIIFSRHDCGHAVNECFFDGDENVSFTTDKAVLENLAGMSGQMVC